jgi:hypothetical protein
MDFELACMEYNNLKNIYNLTPQTTIISPDDNKMRDSLH